ncbi:hypothetical protein AXG93_3337s1060 [Marchantia polymorpha subsp. ruderalis]|uniref:Uncharacterized protein n=1 Tax=Marchantia polymorpha subsp. ruderalis TaxID=1480154 RepID=A0A176W3N2_MARPO|nr:hypothetical protein AXG93_3337s1060 [Marchantia polymorpha subsp. ruderalis]
MEKAEESYCQLRDKSTDELKLRLEKCLNGFAMWGLQTVKWLKLDSFGRQLMSESAGHKQIVELGVESSSDDAVTVTSGGTAPETDSPQTVETPELPL